MRNWQKVLALAVLALAFAGCAAADTIDQSFTTFPNLVVPIDNTCCDIAQTFTAGLNGTLTGVTLDLASLGGATDIFITGVDSTGAPDLSNIFGMTTVSGLFTTGTLITFSQTIPSVAGQQYAILIAPEADTPLTFGNTNGIGGALSLCTAGSSGGVYTCDSSWHSLGSTTIDFQTVVNTGTPEPATLLLFGSGILGVLALRKKNSSKQAE